MSLVPLWKLPYELLQPRNERRSQGIFQIHWHDHRVDGLEKAAEVSAISQMLSDGICISLVGGNQWYANLIYSKDLIIEKMLDTEASKINTIWLCIC